MQTRRRTQCVAWKDSRGRKQWCAQAEKLDPLAMHDKTLCGRVVVLRIGHMRRAPTCPDCRSLLRTGLTK